MKRALFIFGILVILILTGILIFLLFADDTTKKDVFSAFNLNGTESAIDIADSIVDFIIPGEEALPALRQLTFKPVIGSTEINTASSTSPVVYFAEAGTGHIFSLDVVSDVEARVSNITVPVAQKATISSDGALAVIGSEGNQAGYKLTVISITPGSESLEFYEIDERAKDFSISTENEIFYSTTQEESLVGKRHNVLEKTTTTVFKLPFKEAVVLWGKGGSDPIYTYPKTSARLEGYLYEIKNGIPHRLPIAGYGLSAISSGTTIIYSLREGSGHTSYSYETESTINTPLSFSLLPEKCAFLVNASSTILCGQGNTTGDEFPDTWYQGVVSLTDDLWLLDTNSGQQTLLSATKNESGRELDVIYPKLSNDGQRFYFTNKNDSSLWILDRSLISSQE